MGLGTGIYCKYCNEQIYMGDSNANEEAKICGKCNRIKKIVKEEGCE